MDFPRYDSKKALTTDRPEPLRDEAAAQGKLVTQALDVAVDMTVKLDNAFATSQINALNANKSVVLADIKTRAANDPNPNNRDKYIKEIEDFNKNGMKDMGMKAKNASKLDFETDLQLAKIAITGDFHKKAMVQGVQNYSLSMEGFKKTAISSNLEAERQKAIQDAQKLTQQNIDNGIISPDAGANVLKEFDEALRVGEVDNILRVAETDVMLAEKMLRENKKLTDTEKREAIPKIKAASEVAMKRYELAKTEVQYGRQSELIGTLSNQDLDYVAKKQAIDELSKDDGLTAETKKTAELVLNSTMAAEAKTYNADLVEAALMIDSLNVGLAKDTDSTTAKEYLMRVQETKNAIMNMHAKGRLTLKDATDLVGKLDTTAAHLANQRKATKAVRGEDTWNFFTYNYADANKDFKNNLENKAYTDAAMREYFYQLEGMEKEGKIVSGEARKDMVKNINIKYNKKILSGEVVTEDTLPIGTIQNGYKFKGGDRYNKDNWEKV